MGVHGHPEEMVIPLDHAYYQGSVYKLEYIDPELDDDEDSPTYGLYIPTFKLIGFVP